VSAAGKARLNKIFTMQSSDKMKWTRANPWPIPISHWRLTIDHWPMSIRNSQFWPQKIQLTELRPPLLQLLIHNQVSIPKQFGNSILGILSVPPCDQIWREIENRGSYICDDDVVIVVMWVEAAAKIKWKRNETRERNKEKASEMYTKKQAEPLQLTAGAKGVSHVACGRSWTQAGGKHTSKHRLHASMA